MKTESTAGSVAGIEELRIKIQEHAVSSAESGRPTVSSIADVHWLAQSSIIARVTEARGGAKIRKFEKETDSVIPPVERWIIR